MIQFERNSSSSKDRKQRGRVHTVVQIFCCRHCHCLLSICKSKCFAERQPCDVAGAVPLITLLPDPRRPFCSPWGEEAVYCTAERRKTASLAEIWLIIRDFCSSRRSVLAEFQRRNVQLFRVQLYFVKVA